MNLCVVGEAPKFKVQLLTSQIHQQMALISEQLQNCQSVMLTPVLCKSASATGRCIGFTTRQVLLGSCQVVMPVLCHPVSSGLVVVCPMACIAMMANTSPCVVSPQHRIYSPLKRAWNGVVSVNKC